jgi:hypothetical protein
MKIEYPLTPEDWGAFGEHCARTSPAFQHAANVGRVVGRVLLLALRSAFFCAKSSSTARDDAFVQEAAMYQELMDLSQKVTDEKSFCEFLTALRKDCESHQRDCVRHGSQECIEGHHFEAHNTRDFLYTMEDWATRGDFRDGRHYGDPILRRIATMLVVARFKTREPEPDRSDDWDR